MTLIELVEPATSETEARDMLAFCQLQENTRGGRVLPAGGGKPIRCQAFFNDEPACDAQSLALVGLHRVFIPQGFIAVAGIN